MKSFWQNLTKSQKKYVIIGATIVGILLLLEVFLFPAIDDKRQIERNIVVKKQQLYDMQPLVREYNSISRKVEKTKSILAKRPPDFTLFSYLDKKAADAGVKRNIKSINPIKGLSNGAYEESIVEIKLEKVTFKQLSNFLYAAESGQDLIVARKVNALKAKDNPDYIDVLIQFVTIQAI